MNENQKLISRILIDFGLQKGSILAPQNDPKTIKKTTRKINKKMIEKWAQNEKKNLTQLWTESGVLKRFSLYKTFWYVFVRFMFLKNVCFEMPAERPPKIMFTTLCRSLATFGRSWGALESLLAAFGRSWAALGPLLAALGPLLAALGRSWTTCKNHPKIDPKNDRFGLQKGCPKRAKIGP